MTVAQPVTVDQDSFAWQVLSTLAHESSATCEDHRFTVTVTMASDLVSTQAPPPG